MPSRKYSLVGDGSAINMRQKLAREKIIRNISITSNGEKMDSVKSDYICEVRKSPRAPEYVVHYVKTKKDGIQMIKNKSRRVWRPPDKGPSSNTSLASVDENQTESETAEQEKDDMVGLRVIACNKQDGLYYPGHVSHTPESAFAIVNFNYHKRQKVRTQMIIPMSGAIPRPELAAGDFVLVRVFNQNTDSDCFVPAIVEVTPEDFRHHAKFYSVLLYNGQRETTMRKFIVKIGKARFEMAIRYIAHIQQQKILRQESALSDNSTLPSPQSRNSMKSDDDTSSTKPSKPGRGRRKKEKITKKLVNKEEIKVEKSGRKSRSRSRSHSKSSRSRSKSNSSSSSSSSRSRSRSSKSQSDRSRSRSGSSRSSRRSGSSRRKSVSSSRSRSRSSSSSTVRSRSSEKRSRPKSTIHARSSSQSSRSRSRSRSQESKGSSTPRQKSPYDRPRRPTPLARPKSPEIRSESMLESAVTRKDIYNEPRSSHSSMSKVSKYVNVDEKDEVIQTLQYQLEKQKRKQVRQEMRLVRQARKINKIQRKMRDSDNSHNESGQSLHTERSDRTKSRRSSSSETDTSPQRRKGSPDGISYRDSPDLLSQRRSLPGLRLEQEVLARWMDDGWFYRGCVVADGKDQKYVVRDSTGYMEAIIRDDILTDNEHRFAAIQPEDLVIGLHPKYVFSYAPAEVLSAYDNNRVKVEFFDGNISELAPVDVYKISKVKYKQVVEYIKRIEKHLVGQSVVARDDHTGIYKLGVVDSRVGLGQKYYIKWLDGDMSKQNGNHIFEVGKRQTSHEDWSYILAPCNQRSMHFMPAEVIQTNPLVVQFCNGKRSSEATFDQCFWLNKDYYNNARGFILDVKNRNQSENIHSHTD